MRTNRRSPLSGLVAHKGPGHNAIHEMMEAMLKPLSVGIIAGMLFGISIQCTLAYLRRPSIVELTLVWVTTLVLVLLTMLSYRQFVRVVKSLSLGLRGEQAVAAMLAELGREGYIVINGFPGPTSAAGSAPDIDHLLIGPAGVLCIETKTRTKHSNDNRAVFDGTSLTFNGRTADRNAIVQSLAQARQVRTLLRESGLASASSVRSLVAIPGWWVESRGQSEVTVLNPKQIFQHVRSLPRGLDDRAIETTFHCLKKQLPDADLTEFSE